MKRAKGTHHWHNMKLTCTGTRDGASPLAIHAFTTWLDTQQVELGIHGDCLGADSQFHDVLATRGILLEIYPCNISSMRAHKPSNNIHPVAKPLDRNQKMVRDGDVLVAFPATKSEVMRSGTWATIRYARKLHKKIYYFWSDGTISPE